MDNMTNMLIMGGGAALMMIGLVIYDRLTRKQGAKQSHQAANPKASQEAATHAVLGRMDMLEQKIDRLLEQQGAKA